MKDVWPTAINFGDLDYSNSEEATIELTLRYSDVQYENICPGSNISACCSPCGGTADPLDEEEDDETVPQPSPAALL